MVSTNRKYIIVTGGVISGLGKGVSGASIGLLFSDSYKVVPIKLDGYLNVDPGTMNPIEHGEVFVLDDGSEVDMDFGHYERFLGTHGMKEQSITMGKIYDEIRQKERRGDYLGKTVQLIPHVTDLIQEKILAVGEKTNADIVLVEVGGTIGDLENDLFVEAVRQLQRKLGYENIAYIHLTYVPIPYGVKEQKTKPTQQSIHLLQTKGIWPDMIIGRCSEELTDSVKKKIALFANLQPQDIFSAQDVDSIYKIPSVFNKQGIVERLCERLQLKVPSRKRFELWQSLLSHKREKQVTIAIAGKYTDLEDSYASVVESLVHCSYVLDVQVKIEWIDTTKEINTKQLDSVQAVIVPGGFGSRGIDGKLAVIKYVREKKIPYLGICYGLQLAVIEFLKDVCGIKEAMTTEIEPKTIHPAITMLDEQKKVVDMGGTMRLGAYKARLVQGIVDEQYREVKRCEFENNVCIVSERHRHRYEVNPNYISQLEKHGLKIVGYSHERQLVEFIELDSKLHPYFVATQAHPELVSKLETPAPLFYGLVKYAMKRAESKK